MGEYLIVGARVNGGASGDLAISHGVFVLPEELSRGASTLDAEGLVALPGLVDLHTHLREPGGEQAETVLTGSQAAALGGFSAIHAMANTTPVADVPTVTNQVWELGRTAGYVDVRPVGAVSKGLLGVELAAMSAMASSPAKVRVFSDDGHCVSDSALMLRALELVASLGGVVAQHSQDPALTRGAQMNEGALAGRLGLSGWPGVAEETIIARDVLLAQSVGARLHVCHVSTAGSVEVIAWAKAQGIAVTAEVTPHHLLLSEDMVAGFDPRFKVNPPLRRSEDTLALREAVGQGIIDIVATDHAPHSSESKDCSFEEAAFGMLGLETALPVVLHTLVEPGHITMADVGRILSSGPAKIGSLRGYDSPLALGSPAHLTLVDPAQGANPVRGSLSSNNPFEGLALPGSVRHTFFGGTQTVENGHLCEPERVSRKKGEIS